MKEWVLRSDQARVNEGMSAEERSSQDKRRYWSLFLNEISRRGSVLLWWSRMSKMIPFIYTIQKTAVSAGTLAVPYSFARIKGQVERRVKCVKKSV